MAVNWILIAIRLSQLILDYLYKTSMSFKDSSHFK